MGKVCLKEGEQNYTYMLLLAGFALILSGSSAIETGWLICWAGLGFVLVGLSYMRFGVGVFGKQPDGGRAWFNRIILFPYLILNVTMWHLRHRVLSKEDSCNEISPGIWLGRRPIDGEIPDGIITIVDLAAEFSATPQARKLNYICLPALDGRAPDDARFFKLMSELSDSSEPLYIHCAAGHGRSAAVAVGVMLARGLAAGIDEAEEIVQKKRPKISIKKPQREQLERWLHTVR